MNKLRKNFIRLLMDSGEFSHAEMETVGKVGVIFERAIRATEEQRLPTIQVKPVKSGWTPAKRKLQAERMKKLHAEGKLRPKATA